MTRDEAVQRINQGISFRPAGNPLEATIILRLKEAQRDLESGKTLPRWLMREDFPLILNPGSSSIPLPTDFIRESDETRLRINQKNGLAMNPVFLSRRYIIDALQAYRDINVTEEPKVYMLRNFTVQFPNPSDATYRVVMDYYAKALVLDSNIENAWLLNAPEWLIGEAGNRLAMDLRDADAVSLFGEMTKRGRAACFGEDLARELAAQPLVMGRNL